MLALLVCAILVSEPAIAIEHVSIVQPGRTEILREQTVIVRGEKIVSVGATERSSPPEGAVHIDGRGKYLMPGLWDMHVHIASQKSLGLFTANGITGIRVMFGSPSHLIWRQKIANGELDGPKMVVGSPIVDGPKPVWPGSIACADGEQGREAVRKVKAAGYDFVKVYSLLPRDAYFAIADECKKLEIPFEGHVPHSVSIIEAARAGQRTSEHMMEIGMSCSAREAELRPLMAAAVPDGLAKAREVGQKIAPDVVHSFDKRKWDALMKELVRSKMWQCPTLVVLNAVAHMDEPGRMKDERMRFIPSYVSRSWDPTRDFRFKSFSPSDWAAAKANFNTTLKRLRLMHDEGVQILAGTDCNNPFTFPGFSLHDELAFLVEAGLSPTEALATATVNPAKMYGIDKTSGSIGEGYDANLVLLSSNPLENIHNTTKIEDVIVRGKVYDRAALDAVLKACEVQKT